ncbi:MAG TPA: prepilin-type N-terminal cleavage/methylation domain-containing protein [Candidatus Acidoferrales bacterium]
MLKSNHKRTPAGPRAHPRGFSLIELLIVVAIILIIAAIAIPNFLQAKISANQAAAVETVRTITTASEVYSTTWGNGFPPSLAALGGVVPATCNNAVLIDTLVASAPNTKSGYTFAYTPQGAAVTSPPPGCAAGYNADIVTAVPLSVYSGTDSFCADEPGVIHFNTLGTAIAGPAACDALPAIQ